MPRHCVATTSAIEGQIGRKRRPGPVANARDLTADVRPNLQRLVGTDVDATVLLQTLNSETLKAEANRIEVLEVDLFDLYIGNR